MNYNKIYDDFIKDRIAKQPIKPQYFEKHHILPKSLGGSDEPANIIRLTPEDHYFAHLCLAKIYGGSQWSSVLCMIKMLNSKKRADKTFGFANRKIVAVARKKSALHKSEAYSGRLTRNTKKQYKLHHIDGRIIFGAIVDLSEQSKLSVPSVYRLVNKMQGMSYSGWYFDKTLMKKSKDSKKLFGVIVAKSFSGYNKKAIKCNETGKIYESISEAKRLTGLNISNYFHKNRSHVGGYTWSYV